MTSLIDYFIKPLAMATLFTKGEGSTDRSSEEIFYLLLNSLRESMEKAKKAGFSHESVEKAGFAVCSWIDEKLLSPSSVHREFWKTQPLQKILFNTTKAGELFFQILESLQDSQEDRQVREVFYYCLAMDFKGMYFNDQEALEKIMEQNKKLLNIDTGKSLILFPSAYPEERKRKKRWFKLGIVQFLILSALIFAGLFYLLIHFYENLLNEQISGFIK